MRRTCQILRVQLFSACMVLLAGCVTDGSPRPMSDMAPALSKLPATRSGSATEHHRASAEPVLADATQNSSARQEAEVISAGFSTDSQPAEKTDSYADKEPPWTEGPAASSVSAGQEEMNLESLEQLALTNNPAIRQATAAVYKATGTRLQVGLRPNPTVGYFGSQLGDDGTEQQGAFISQDIVLGDKLALNRAVINKDVQALLWEVEAQRYRVLTDIRRRFYDALAAQRRLELSSSFQEVARKGVRVAEERMQALEGTRPDILQSEIQLNEVDLITQQARIDFEAAWRELATIAGTPHMAAPVLVGELEAAAVARDLETAYAELLGRSPELQAAYTRVQRARANLGRQRAQPIPNLQAELAFGYDHGTGSDMTNVQLGIPLPVHNKNQGNICAAQAEYARATHDARRLELSLRSRLIAAMRDYEVAHVTVDRYQNQILPKAGESLRLSEEAHAAGEFDFLRVLVARRTFFDVNLNYLQALANLAKANAVIEGLQLSGGLSDAVDYEADAGLRDQALSGQ